MQIQQVFFYPSSSSSSSTRAHPLLFFAGHTASSNSLSFRNLEIPTLYARARFAYMFVLFLSSVFLRIRIFQRRIGENTRRGRAQTGEARMCAKKRRINGSESGFFAFRARTGFSPAERFCEISAADIDSS